MNEIDIYRRAMADGAFLSLLFEGIGMLLITLVYYACMLIKKDNKNERQI